MAAYVNKMLTNGCLCEQNANKWLLM